MTGCARCGDAQLCRIFGGCMAENERLQAEDEKRRRALDRDARLAARRRLGHAKRKRRWQARNRG
jgi:hypothetical protein